MRNKKMTTDEILELFKSSEYQEELEGGKLLNHNVSSNDKEFAQYEIHVKLTNNNRGIYKAVDKIFHIEFHKAILPDSDNLHDDIRYLFKELRYSQAFIAKMANLSQSRISKIINEGEFTNET